jgi:hypothetical protein
MSGHADFQDRRSTLNGHHINFPIIDVQFTSFESNGELNYTSKSGYLLLQLRDIQEVKRSFDI